MCNLRDALADLIVDCRDYLLTITHGVELRHQLSEGLDRLSANRLAVHCAKHVAKEVFESNQRLQTHVEVLDFHDASLSYHHRLLAGQKDQNLEGTLLNEADLAFGSLSRGIR